MLHRRRKRTIPTRDECLSLMRSQGMLENIVQHSLAVEKVALFLSSALIESGEALHSEEIRAGALLHDITKTNSIHTRENHAITGENLLRQLGYPEIGKIVRYHVEIPCEIILQPRLSSEEIVNYADKRVRHDMVVDLGDRFHDLYRRYGKTPEACARLQALERQSVFLEEKIFSRIGMYPEEVTTQVLDSTGGG
ncbi:MAG: HDIG domain-containing protein [Deltaproteobacteria bacterium]|nr:HDIG domain-containing protein [Deltaproteobacteria bacterium]